MQRQKPVNEFVRVIEEATLLKTSNAPFFVGHGRAFGEHVQQQLHGLRARLDA
jgi:hypothetical protein